MSIHTVWLGSAARRTSIARCVSQKISRILTTGHLQYRRIEQSVKVIIVIVVVIVTIARDLARSGLP